MLDYTAQNPSAKPEVIPQPANKDFVNLDISRNTFAPPPTPAAAPAVPVESAPSYYPMPGGAPMVLADAGSNPPAPVAASTKKPSMFSFGTKYDQFIREASEKHQMDPHVIRAMIQKESSGNPKAKSEAGASGLMQLMPGTAPGVGVTDLFDARQSIMGGTRYLKRMLNAYHGDLDKALAAYNAGPGNVDPKKGTNIPEVLQYVKSVRGLIDASRTEYPNPFKGGKAEKFGAKGGAIASAGAYDVAPGAKAGAGAGATAPPTTPGQTSSGSNDFQFTVPSLEQLGVRSQDPRFGFNEFQAVTKPPLPPKEVYMQEWTKPESIRAAVEMKSMLATAFAQSTLTPGGLNNFLQSPYAFMLSQSVDKVSQILTATAIKNGGEDPDRDQYVTLPAVLDAVEMNKAMLDPSYLQKMKENNPERFQYLTTTATQNFNSMPSRYREELMKQGSAAAQTWAKDLLSSHASLVSAYSTAKAQQSTAGLAWDKYRTVDIPTSAASINETNARAEGLRTEAALRSAEAEKIRILLPWLAADAPINHELQQIRLEEARLGRDKEYSSLGMDVTDKNLKTSVDLFKSVTTGASSASQGIANCNKELDALGEVGQRTLTEADFKNNSVVVDPNTGARYTIDDVKPGKPPVKIWTDKKALEIIQRRKIHEERLRKYTQAGDVLYKRIQTQTSDRDTAVSAYMMTPALAYAARKGITSLPDLVQESKKDGNISVDRIRPSDPMRWDAVENRFRAVSLQHPMPKASADAIYEALISEPSAMQALCKNNEIMSYPEWQAYVDGSNREKPELGLKYEQYQHFVMICNHIKQTDFLLQSYHDAFTHGQSLKEYSKTHTMDAPTVFDDKGNAVTRTGAPIKKRTKGGKQ